MTAYARHAASLKAVQDYHGEACPVIGYDGRSIPVLPGSAARRKDLGPGGYHLDCDLSFVTNLDRFGSKQPTLKETITYMGDSYRVTAIHKLAGGLTARFECVDTNAGA